MPDKKHENLGWAWGFLGVILFSVTLPATRVAVADFDPLLVGLARASVPAVLAGLVLLATRQRLPARGDIFRLLLASTGIVYGFPILMSVAMKDLPSAHGAVVTGIMPLATAAIGAIVSGDRPSWGFWLCGLAGSALVVIYAVGQGAGGLAWADLLLVIGILTAALGYAVGGQASKTLGSWQTICWIMVLALPLTLLLIPLINPSWPDHAPSWRAWGGIVYVVLISQFFSFFAWYRGTALGGITRVSQLLLLQPCLTLMFSALVAGETLGWREILFTLAIIGVVALSRRTKIHHAPSEA